MGTPRGDATVATGSGLLWRKSSASGGGASTNCIEVAISADAVLVRDSKVVAGPMLGFGSPDWAAFVSTLRAVGR
jgi:hypothetical protein